MRLVVLSSPVVVPAAVWQSALAGEVPLLLALAVASVSVDSVVASSAAASAMASSAWAGALASVGSVSIAASVWATVASAPALPPFLTRSAFRSAFPWVCQLEGQVSPPSRPLPSGQRCRLVGRGLAIDRKGLEREAVDSAFKEAVGLAFQSLYLRFPEHNDEAHAALHFADALRYIRLGYDVAQKVIDAEGT